MCVWLLRIGGGSFLVVLDIGFGKNGITRFYFSDVSAAQPRNSPAAQACEIGLVKVRSTGDSTAGDPSAVFAVQQDSPPGGDCVVDDAGLGQDDDVYGQLVQVYAVCVEVPKVCWVYAPE